MRHLYPPDWPLIRKRILARAGNRCERCGKPGGVTVEAVFGGRWRDSDLDPTGWRDCNGRPCPAPDPDGTDHCVRVVLTIAHTPDRNPANCDPANLLALCSYCHFSLDRSQNIITARRNRLLRAGQTTLPGF
jgi:hypothetical protein